MTGYIDSKMPSGVVGRKGDLRDAISVGFEGVPFEELGVGVIEGDCF